MQASFDELLAAAGGLPPGSGASEVLDPSAAYGSEREREDLFQAFLVEVEAASSFRGDALLSRVLAAHPPGLPSGKWDDAVLADSPLAAAALVELYSDVAQRGAGVLAPLVLGRPVASRSQVEALLGDVRTAVSTAENCECCSSAVFLEVLSNSLPWETFAALSSVFPVHGQLEPLLRSGVRRFVKVGRV